jgi:hypothetical protein
MAGDWIKMRGNLWDDPRISKICDLTGQGEAAIIGGLYWLWATADQHTEDGILPGLTAKSIDRKTGIDGFSDALITIGWLANHPEGVQIIDFHKHNGASAKKRSETAKRVASHRNKGFSASEENQCNANSVTESVHVRYENVTGALAREEKRREDIKEKEKDKKEKRVRAAVPDRPSSVPESVWSDFLALRKAKQAPLTTTALGSIEREARKAGISLTNALTECCSRGWRGFKSEWITENKKESFRERDERLAMDKYESITGKIHPNRISHEEPEIIDSLPDYFLIGNES